MKSFSLPVILAASALFSGCATNSSKDAGQYPPTGNAYENPPGYAGRQGGYPAAGDYVEVAPVPPSGGSAAYQPPAYPDNPSSASAGSYKVQKGDTLYSISRHHSTTVAALKSANGLTADTIRIGQVLRIP